tara:strand:- start:1 stop:207 length:207 start_codon:yes stop_codon:yes gene_type:complete
VVVQLLFGIYLVNYHSSGRSLFCYTFRAHSQSGIGCMHMSPNEGSGLLVGVMQQAAKYIRSSQFYSLF